MKKIIVAIGVVIAVLGGGYAVSRSSVSNTSTSYGSINVNIGALDEKAVTQICKSASSHTRIVCLADELKKTLDRNLLAKLQLTYSVTDAQKWSNFPPAGYRNRVGPTLDKFTKKTAYPCKGNSQGSF